MLALPRRLLWIAAIWCAAVVIRGSDTWAQQTQAVLELTPDAVSQWEYRFDRSIEREVIARNTGGAVGVWFFRPSAGICMPQENRLYLGPGESVRIICAAQFDVAVPGARNWALGTTHSVPLVLSFFDHNPTSSETPLRTLTLDNTVTVTWQLSGLPGGSPLTHTNATITGTVVDAATNQLLDQAQVVIQNTEASWSTPRGGPPVFSVAVKAHQRPFSKTWQSYVVSAGAPGYATAHVVVMPQPEQTTGLTIALRQRSAQGSYRLIRKFDTTGPPARIAVSADGRYAAIAPYTDANLPASKGNLNFFDIQQQTLLWTYPLLGKVFSVDVSDYGEWIAAPYPGPNVGQTGASDLVLLDRNGKVVWVRHVNGEFPSAMIAGTQVQVESLGPREVKFSHDARWLAYGTSTGSLVVIDRATQALRWRVFLRGQVRHISWSADDSRMYATSGDGNVYAFDARTGDSTWKTFIGGWSDSWAFSNNFILTSAKQGYAIAAIRVSDGSIAWQYPVVGTSNGLAISPDESLFATGNIVGSAPNTAVFDASGSLLWAVPENADALVFSGNGKYLLTEVAGSENPAEPADHLHLYDAQTGEELWSQPLVEPWAGWNHENGVLYVSDDALMILVGSQNNGYVYFFKGQSSGVPGAPTSLIRPRPVQR